MRIVIFGAHPDDPDSGAGGFIALATEKEHEVIAISLTRGELTGRGKSIEENAIINEKEAIEAFKILGAEVKFLDFKDGNVWATREATNKVKELLGDLTPDIVITHWPVDTHSDHRATAIITMNAIHLLEKECHKSIPLLFYEVMTGIQTLCFHPEIYVDITSKADLKKKACYAHKNCFPERWYPVHEEMMRFRGLEMGVKYSEAFVSYKKPFVKVFLELL